jgi:hypothetical protein
LPAKLDADATAAKNVNQTLDEIGTAAEGWLQGKWADHEQSLRESLQAVAKTLGVNTPDLDTATGNYQDFVKLVGNVSRQAAHDLGAVLACRNFS